MAVNFQFLWHNEVVVMSIVADDRHFCGAHEYSDLLIQLDFYTLTNALIITYSSNIINSIITVYYESFGESH